MIRGISFFFPEQLTYDGFTRLFDGVQTDSLVWKNILRQCEIICEPNDRLSEDFTEAELLNFLRSGPYIISIKLQAYSGGRFSDCRTFEEFLCGDCKIMFLICDVREADVYVKDPGTVERIYRNALNAGFENVRILTDENDRRTALDVINYD